MALTPFFKRGDLTSIFDSPLDRFFDPSAIFESGPSRQFAKDASAVANTRVDWVETPDAHVIKADLPGLSKEEIKIEIQDGNTLVLSGERKKESTQETDKWHRVERSYGCFLRKFRLPEDSKVEEINAKVDNGVLTINVLESKFFLLS
ncbi:18.1 kDa class I heat shock protein-like isoform X2 [Selaginella moellendorffii]|uniref:18.1 kDa class I heat shock protein-like isoform X2 n=1 Tax=Selaginella moellendorffii TaxID=88036 RepID=UPI000D1CB512|nr:18.1 kDa class I heat shock protein-like isoform X2 [Selaginella moellendorffii]|eukprot:XP_024526158.1 18.1 kDa class I heat shock protein-like isoform X2 [Selaginella moellendorffii]